MKIYPYIISVVAFVFFVASVPITFAHTGETGTGGDSSVGVTASSHVDSTKVKPSTRLRANLSPKEVRERRVKRFRENNRLTASTSDETRTALKERVLENRTRRLKSHIEDRLRNATSTRVRERNLEQFAERFRSNDFATATPVWNVRQLKRIIKERRQELAGEASSIATSSRQTMKRINRVRLAVHSIIAAKKMLGVSGKTVSKIAEQVNESLASTTQAQVQIKRRGFWTRLFFGGDRQAAKTIQREVTQNRERVQQMNTLINQSSTNADVKTTLQTQVQAMKDEQKNLQSVADEQKSLWGIFSWRLF